MTTDPQPNAAHDALVARLGDMRERWIALIKSQGFGDQFDGDIDLLQEARAEIERLKRSAIIPNAAVAQMQDSYRAALEQAERERDEARAECEALRKALLGVLADPHGCSLCDYGLPRNKDKGHQPDCTYEAARAALRDG